jgi:hypothetical protein
MVAVEIRKLESVLSRKDPRKEEVVVEFEFEFEG